MPDPGLPAVTASHDALLTAVHAMFADIPMDSPLAARQGRRCQGLPLHHEIIWRLPSGALEEKFIKEATAQKMIGLKGHRDVGGCRASVYNACPAESVDALVAFMADFQAKNG